MNKQNVIVSLTPVVIMTGIGGMALLFLSSGFGQVLLAALLLNIAASIGDLLIVRRVRRWPAEALFVDQEGIRVFTQLRNLYFNLASGHK